VTWPNQSLVHICRIIWNKNNRRTCW